MIQNLFHALLAFKHVFIINQRFIAVATLHTSYKTSTSPRFMVELSITSVDFEMQC